MANSQQSLDNLLASGFSLDEINKSPLTIAFLSLRSAFRAWFATYQSFRWRFHLVDPTNKEIKGIEKPVQLVQIISPHNHSIDYFDEYAEAVFHFHHFVELIIKDILRKHHELLAVDAAKDPIGLFKLLKGEEVSSDDARNFKSIEFGDALYRLNTLIKTIPSPISLKKQAF